MKSSKFSPKKRLEKAFAASIRKRTRICPKRLRPSVNLTCVAAAKDEDKITDGFAQSSKIRALGFPRKSTWSKIDIVISFLTVNKSKPICN